VQEENRIAREVVDAALKLHRHFGPGIYESVYEPVLSYELRKRNLTTRHQTPVPLVYEGITFEIGFKTDVIVNNLVILELKSVEKLEPVHFKQLLTCLRLTGLRLGLLINFGESLERWHPPSRQRPLAQFGRPQRNCPLEAPVHL
jgi:GxxExxY protein